MAAHRLSINSLYYRVTLLWVTFAVFSERGFFASQGRHVAQWRSQEFNLGVYVLTSHCNFKTCVNVPHMNKTVTDFGGIYTDIPPVATPLTLPR